MLEKEYPKKKNTSIGSGRLLVRRPEDSDRQCLERLFCDPGMMRYLGGPWDSNTVSESLQEWHDIWGTNNNWYGILVRQDTMEPIGTAGFTESSIPGEPGLELSWFILPEHQKQGFASEITHELLHFAFDILGVERVLAETHPENPASNRVLEKLGFRCLGERHHKYDYLPRFETQVLWELTRGIYTQQSVHRYHGSLGGLVSND